MYVIVVYDVETTRVARVCKYLRRFLHWVQNSAFEGELTESQLETIRAELKRLIDKECDSVYIYCVPEKNLVVKHVVGKEKAPTEQFVL